MLRTRSDHTVLTPRPALLSAKIRADMFRQPIALLLGCALTAGIAAPPGNPQSQSGPSPSADADKIHFTGEAMRGQPFTKDVGHNLFFRLTPATSDEGGGWVIEMLPPTEPAAAPVDPEDPKPASDPIEFASIATPPYHAYNDRYIAAAFGYSAKEALGTPLRKFNFVQSVQDEERANEVVNAALYPSTVGESERARVAAEAAALMLGTGQLRILKSKIASGKEGSPDVIAWIRFEVDLNFSPGLTLQQVLAPHPPAPKK